MSSVSGVIEIEMMALPNAVAIVSDNRLAESATEGCSGG
jgi:hypothetical protein